MHLSVASCYRLIIEFIIQLVSVTERQSQTKIVGTLPFNAVFYLLARLLSLPVLFIAVNSNLVHQH